MAITPFKPSVGRQVYRGSRAGTMEAEIGANVRASMRQIIENFKGFVGSLDSQAAEIVREALEPTFEKSQILVPVKTGALQQSGFLLPESRAGGGAQVVMGYAPGGNPDYAVFVHEDLEAVHEPPTQAKFLQQPLEDDEEAIQERIIQGFKTAAGLENT